MKERDSFTKSLRYKNPPLILDGAMGSYLHSLGYEPHPKLWFSLLNKLNPEAVIKVHTDYINAGADIITTNTFRTNPQALKGTTFSSAELVSQAVKCAKESAGSKNVFIAGSNPPAEDSYQKERTLSTQQLIFNHEKHINLLFESGCDFILNETQSHLDEIEIICKVCYESKIPFIISFYYDQDQNILSGERLKDILGIVLAYNPAAIGFNCISKSSFESFLNKLTLDYPWGFYLNYGIGKVTDKKITDIEVPGSENKIISMALKKNAVFVGGCCGSGPEHILNIKNFIDGNYNS